MPLIIITGLLTIFIYQISAVSVNTTRCTPNKFYCGGQLVEMGYESDDSDEVIFPNGKYYRRLYECQNNGRDAQFLEVCHFGCVNSSTGSYCRCSTDQPACGYQLRQTKISFDLDDQNLYRCTSQTNATKLETCANGCDYLSDPPQCRRGQKLRCTQDENHCGQILVEKYGYKDLDLGAIYKCEANKNVTMLYSCSNSCTIWLQTVGCSKLEKSN